MQTNFGQKENTQNIHFWPLWLSKLDLVVSTLSFEQSKLRWIYIFLFKKKNPMCFDIFFWYQNPQWSVPQPKENYGVRGKENQKILHFCGLTTRWVVQATPAEVTLILFFLDKTVPPHPQPWVSREDIWTWRDDSSCYNIRPHASPAGRVWLAIPEEISCCWWCQSTGHAHGLSRSFSLCLRWGTR